MTRHVTLLCIDAAAEDVAAELLDLVTTNSMLNVTTRVATDPLQLVGVMGEETRAAHVVVLDGLENPTYDILNLISLMKVRRTVGVMAIVRNHAQRLLAQAAGVDICHRLPLRRRDFLTDVVELLDHYDPLERTGPEVTQEEHRKGGANGAPLRLATVRSSLAGPKSGRPTVPILAAPGSGVWTLDGGTRVLVSPDGVRFALSSHENRLLEALFKSKDRTLTHEHWARLIDLPVTSAMRRLAVFVSRLRQKCLKQKCELPLRSDHGRGYSFLAYCAIVDQGTTGPHREPSEAEAA